MIGFHSQTARVGAVALALVAVLLAGVAPATAATTVHNETVALDRVSTVEADVTFADSTDATVELVTDDGTIIDYTTVSGSSSTVTASLNATDAAADSANLSVSSDDAANVSISETRVVATQEIEVADATNETVSIALGLDEIATVDVALDNATGGNIWNTSVTDSDADALSWSVDSTDGLEDGNLTTNATVAPAGAYSALHAEVGDGVIGAAALLEDGSAGPIAGLIVALVLVVLAGWVVGDD